MLKIVYMAADVHIDIVPFKDRQKPLLQIASFAFIFIGKGIDRMVSDYDNPILGGCGEHGIKPCQLCLVS